MRSIRHFVFALAAASAASPFAVHAAPTVAGTSIQNTAQVTYTSGGTPLTATSNTASLTVAEILDVTVTISSATVPVAPGAPQKALVFTVTNTGNGTEAFNLIALSAGVTGDNFDPVLATPAVYFDTDGSNDFSAGDLAYVPGTNEPVLAPGADVRVIVLNNIPAGVVDNNRGRSQLTAASRTGTGAPGTVFAGQGDGGVDAVDGTTGGDGVIFGEYVVEALSLTAVKSQLVSDTFGGTRPLPGARITYQIVVTTSGTGTAAGSLFSDQIPVNTTYVPGTLKLNNLTLSDGGDADAGEYTTTPAAAVRVNLGDLTQASGTRTIEFAVTIN